MIKLKYLEDWKNEFKRGTGGSWFVAKTDSDTYELGSTNAPDFGDTPILVILDNDGGSINGAGGAEDAGAVIVAMNTYLTVIDQAIGVKYRDAGNIVELEEIITDLKTGKTDEGVQRLSDFIAALRYDVI